MNLSDDELYPIDFSELELRFGKETALAILRRLEQLEGVTNMRVAHMSFEERLQNVFAEMKKNMASQTRH